MTLSLQLNQYGHAHRFLVAPASPGWDVREEQDSAVVYQGHRHDWSLVESDMQLFKVRAHSFGRGALTALRPARGEAA